MSLAKLIPPVALLAVFVSGCAPAVIEGTQVPDTPDNRTIVGILGEMRHAFQTRNTEALLRLVSPKYFEDMGTTDPSDDYGYEELSTSILPNSMELTKEFHVDFEVHDVVVQGDQAWADLRYSSRARIDLPSGTLWDTHKEFNRVVFARESDGWRIIGGL